MTENQLAADNMNHFTGIVRQRSADNEIALRQMIDASILSQAVSIIRQEIDSLIRVRYILDLVPSDRDIVIANFLSGSFRGPNGVAKITDKDMINFASRLEGWPKVAYDFGCAFVHLSHLHAYRPQDPLGALDIAQRDEIIDYLRKYHGKPNGCHPDVHELLGLAEPIFEKISGNIDYYLEDLLASIPPQHVF